MRIFISYGHDEHVGVAEKILRDLKARGHEVWFDQERLKPGVDWEKRIEEGLDWVSGIPAAGRVLLLMTPHSVRRPNGFCLNEIAWALQRNVSLIPVMLVWCEPPLSICRIQWLDMKDCVPLSDRLSRYELKFQQLVEVLETDIPRYEGAQSRLLSLLQPLPFDADIEKHLPKFTGRHWVFRQIDEWLSQDSGSRVLWIVGKPGVGKTALSAWLCAHRREIAAFHLCRFGHAQKADPRRCILSIAYQLSSQLPDYQSRLNSLHLEQIVSVSNAETLFDNLIVQPLSGDFPKPDRDIVVLIDGLDEATQGGRNELASLLSTQAGKTPDWFRLILTSRPEPEVMHPLQGLCPYVLDASTKENENDIREYLMRELRPYFAGGEVPEDVVETILSRSEGLFLYVEWLRQELAEHHLSMDRIDEFPRGLGGVYAHFFQRRFADLEAYETRMVPAFEAILSAREPLPLDYLSDLLDWRDRDRVKFLQMIGSLFSTTDGTIRPFHRSLSEWLTDPDRAGPYFVGMKDGHQRLADYGFMEYSRWKSHPQLRMSGYALSHLPGHLIALRKGERLQILLTDLSFLREKCLEGMTYDLVADYRHFSESNGMEEWLNNVRIQDFQQFVREQAHVLSRNPELILQQAANAPDESAPATEASILLERLPEGCIWIRWINKPEVSAANEITFVGHQDTVTCCVSSPDGKWILSGSQDRSLKLWDARTGMPVRTLTGHERSVNACCFSPDGDRILSVSSDKSVRLWSVAQGRELAVLDEHDDVVEDCAFSHSGKHFVSASRDRTLRLWDSSTQKVLHTFSGHMAGVDTCKFSPDDRVLLSSSSARLRLWDIASGEVIRTLDIHTAPVLASSFSPDGKRIISASEDGTVIVWDVHQGTEIATLSEHQGPVKSCSYSPDGRFFVSVSWDRTMKVWDAETFAKLADIPVHTGWPTACNFLPDGKHVVTASGDRTLILWSIDKTLRTVRKSKHETFVIRCLFASPSSKLITASEDATIKIWNVRDGSQTATLSAHRAKITDCVLSPDAKRAVSSSEDKTLRVWDIENAKELFELKGHSGSVDACDYSSDGKWILSASRDGTLKIWNTDSGLEQLTLVGHQNWVSCGRFSPDSTHILSGSWDGTLRLWDTNTAECNLVMQGHTRPVLNCAFSPDGKKALSVSADARIKLWDMESGEEIGTSIENETTPAECAFTPDGSLVVSVAVGRVIRLWDAATLREVAMLSSGTGTAFRQAVTYRGRHFSFSPDGSHIVIANYADMIQIWSLAGPNMVAQFKPAGSIWSLSWSPNNNLIAAGSNVGDVYILEFKTVLPK